MPQDPVIYSSNLQSGLVINSPLLQNPKIQEGVVLITAATTLNATDHAGRLMVFNTASGATVTLPAATGTGNRYRFAVGVTVTSNQDRINVTGDDAFYGVIHVAQDSGDTSIAFEAGSDADQINLNGSTQGGIKGDYIEVTDILADSWLVTGWTQATGIEATPLVTGQVS